MDHILDKFKQIAAVPRCSGSEEKICKFLKDFAHKNSLEYYNDKNNNVIIKKVASKGYEDAPTVILQGHIDMVCVKDPSSNQDFSEQGIEIIEKNGYLSGNKTTLGADNGIAIAYCMAILENKELKHPALEILMTSEEETTMGGAEMIDPTELSGKILMNLDSEEEGIFLVSSAGGVEVQVCMDIDWKPLNKGYNSYRIKIKDLYGGHSGADIDKGRANANKLMGRLLEGVGAEMEIQLSEVNGGTKPNVITSECVAIVSILKEKEQLFMDLIGIYKSVFKNEFRISEPKLDISCKKLNQSVEQVLTDEYTKKSIVLLNLLPHGVQTMSMDIDGLVESSSNLAIVETNGKTVECIISVRSSVETLKEEIVTRIDMVSDVMGAKMEKQSPYPAWQYKEQSYIRNVMIETYLKKYGKEPEIQAIHAGLECGILDAKIEDLDIISVGPNIYDAHTINERIEINSAKRVYEYLIEVLENIK